MNGYGATEVAKLLGLSVGQVRAYVRAGFLDPARGPRGELRFSFQDLVLLRTAQGLVAARIPARKVRSTLRKLRDRLPEGRPLRAVHITAEGGDIIVGEGDARWQAASGQVLFDFDTAELTRTVAPFLRAASHRQGPDDLDAAGWYERGCDLEDADPAAARTAYERATRLDPSLADAQVNLGRLLHEAGDPEAAAACYRRALEVRSDDATAAFNLGVALEDLQRFDEAIAAYAQAIASDPACADAHYNVSLLYEKRGEGPAALRHLRTYRNLAIPATSRS